MKSLAHIDPAKALPHLIESLSTGNYSVHETVAGLLAEIGEPANGPVLDALKDETKIDGALLALDRLPRPSSQAILGFARAAVSRAGEYDALMRGVQASASNARAAPGRSDAMRLLADSLHDKSHRYGIHGLHAIGLLGDRDAMSTAIENLQSRDASQQANVMEALESISSRWRDILQPLMRLWEDERSEIAGLDWDRLLNDEDQWIRECAAFAKQYGESKMDSISTLSLMDRILFLKASVIIFSAFASGP